MYGLSINGIIMSNQTEVKKQQLNPPPNVLIKLGALWLEMKTSK
jgi:hypothetical protein